MDIPEEIRLSKGDKLLKSSSLPDSYQNKPLNNPKSSSGVKGIGRVSPMKSKVTGNSDSPRSRRVTRSERDIVFNPQPVSQFNHITGKANVDKDKVKDTAVDAVNDKALDVVKEKHKTELPKDNGMPVVKEYVPTKRLPKENANDKADWIGCRRLLGRLLMLLKISRLLMLLKISWRPVVDVTDKSVVDVVKDSAPEVVKEKRKTDLLKDKPKGKV
ncbi:hypothetical protein Tco_1353033 [Tanacetum coccineum]